MKATGFLRTRITLQWKREQQLHGNGIQMRTNLDTIQELCEALAELIWNTRQQVIKVNTPLLLASHRIMLSWETFVLATNLDTIQELCEALAELIWNTRQQVIKVNQYNSHSPLELRQQHYVEILKEMTNQESNLDETGLRMT
ncbi:unnamed protein product [Plutella xylostella]|uniref:(diamondback moth) hypothetical protein n=1 Tax=Plutella xylostella TaxID=51655 RepID=A0A8S4G8X7_PLUXY|nr:unnamed protein product [Plutella xylostella]